MTKKKIQQKENPFEINLDDFIKNIDSSRSSLRLSVALITLQYKTDLNKLVDFVDRNGKKRTLRHFTIKYEDTHYYKKLKRNVEISKSSLKFAPRSALISLVSQFDAFMGVILKNIILLHPEILNNSEKTLTFSLLSDFNKIEEAKNYIIEKEIDGILRENHTYHFKWLEDKLAIPLRKDLSIWKDFIELTERRNLFAHCGGKISSQYIAACKENKVGIANDYKVGYELEVTQQYIDLAYRCLYELGVKLSHVIWRKLNPNDLCKADESLNEICYNLIKRESYDLASAILDFAVNTLKNHFDETSTNLFIINTALSKKLNGDKKSAYKIIASKDWSASSNDFKLAKDVILDNNENVFLLMKKIGKKGEIVDIVGYRNWPLFNNLKNNKLFKDKFKQIYKEDYELKENRLEYDLKIIAKKKNQNLRRSKK